MKSIANLFTKKNMFTKKSENQFGKESRLKMLCNKRTTKTAIDKIDFAPPTVPPSILTHTPSSSNGAFYICEFPNKLWLKGSRK